MTILVTRLALSCWLVYAVWTETGPWTAMFVAFATFAFELSNMVVGQMLRDVNRLKRHAGIPTTEDSP